MILVIYILSLQVILIDRYILQLLFNHVSQFKQQSYNAGGFEVIIFAKKHELS